MFFQKLLWLVALFGAIWALRRLFSGSGSRDQVAGGGRSVPTEVAGDMVRDRVCNTFLPRSRALTLGSEQGEPYFCSERCRKIHLDRKAS